MIPYDYSFVCLIEEHTHMHTHYALTTIVVNYCSNGCGSLASIDMKSLVVNGGHEIKSRPSLPMSYVLRAGVGNLGV